MLAGGLDAMYRAALATSHEAYVKVERQIDTLSSTIKRLQKEVGPLL